MSKETLHSVILRNYQQAALVPCATIAVVLISLYFIVLAQMRSDTTKALTNESLAYFRQVADSQVTVIDQEIDAITGLTSILGNGCEQFYATLEDARPVDQSQAYEFADNGIYYQRGPATTSLFYAARTTMTEARKQFAWQSDRLSPLFKSLCESNDNVVAAYINTHDSMNRYYPFIPEVFRQFDPLVSIPDFNFYYLADEQHNPERKPVWTGLYLDPAGQGWMMSCIAPVYRDDSLLAVAGLDMTVKQVLGNIESLKLHWGAHAFMVDADGTILAMPKEVSDLFGLPELSDHQYVSPVIHDTQPSAHTVLKVSDPSVAAAVAELLPKYKAATTVRMNGREYQLVQSTVRRTNWKLITIADNAYIFESAQKLDSRASDIGLMTIAGVLLLSLASLYSQYLRSKRMARDIAAPIIAATQASKELSSGNFDFTIPSTGIEELDSMSSLFKATAAELKELYETLHLDRNQLEQDNQSLQRRVELRTQALHTMNEHLKQDMVGKEQAEKALHHAVNFTTSLLESIPLPVFFTDHTAHFEGCNTAFTKLTGLDRDFLMGRNASQLPLFDNPEDDYQQDIMLIANPGVRRHQRLMTDASGTVHSVTITKIAYSTPDDTPAGIICLLETGSSQSFENDT